MCCYLARELAGLLADVPPPSHVATRRAPVRPVALHSRARACDPNAVHTGTRHTCSRIFLVLPRSSREHGPGARMKKHARVTCARPASTGASQAWAPDR